MAAGRKPAPLAAYVRKRDFTKTAEPRGRERKRPQGLYVIQKHRASQLHYDLRLEAEGVPQVLVGAEGAQSRHRGEATGDGRGGPSGRVRLLRRDHP